MKITAETNAIPKKETYPVIKENHNGVIVLFTKQCTGVCLSPNNIGDFSETWWERDFTIIPDSITLYQE